MANEFSFQKPHSSFRNELYLWLLDLFIKENLQQIFLIICYLDDRVGNFVLP